jgi:predicted kinase
VYSELQFKYMLVGLIGPPKSGKLTFAKYLQENFNYELIDLRKNIQSEGAS